MLFNSVAFLFFFPIVTVGYFRLPTVRSRQWWLVIASTIFYMAFIPAYALLLYATIIVDYFAGLKISAATGRSRRAWLLLSIVANVGCLAVFKYANFTLDNLNHLFGVLGSATRFKPLDFILPVGLSFHTFQAMSYTIEVYRGNQKEERSFLTYALYVMFYPQLVAGPIERPQNVIHQLTELHEFDADRVASGFRRMLWGFFKKVVVADRLAVIVGAYYSAPAEVTGPLLLVATAAFSFQIYADFSGYSDIALGTAEVMGVRLMTNFRQPYCSQSVGEFWSRWHISLSTWFRDYLYIPLGGNRVSPLRRRFNLLLTFLISGLWHGANWTYIVWGALNGLFLSIESAFALTTQKPSLGFQRFLRTIVTFTLVSFAWIFFRATSIHDALVIVRRLPTGFGLFAHPRLLMDSLVRAAGGEVRKLVLTILSLLALVVVDAIASRRRADAVDVIATLTTRKRWMTYFALGWATVMMGLYGNQQFIYFQF